MACRWKRCAVSSAAMPAPSSVTWTWSRPPVCTSTETLVAPPSSAFSTSSFTTDAGRSTTSPAAMRAATSGAKTWMGTPQPPEPQGCEFEARWRMASYTRVISLSSGSSLTYGRTETPPRADTTSG